MMKMRPFMTKKKRMINRTLALLSFPLAVAAFAAPRALHAQVAPGIGGGSIGGGGAGSYQSGPVKRDPIERVADGKVVNKADAPISGAIVYLKDSKSLEVKTFITDDAGHFHFGQLGQNIDYELWAESYGSRSKSKGISSFDSKNAYNFTLKIDAPKPAAAKVTPPPQL
jgi:hypothetical protein